MYKITFYVPVTHVEMVKSAMFTAGAGRIGGYDCCSWQVLGVGQFRALEGAQPFLGTINTLEQVAEYKVEMVCCAENLSAAIEALTFTHPYETPAYDVMNVVDLMAI